jgi:hypothetical protein
MKERLRIVHERFGLCQEDIEALRAWPVRKVRYAPATSATEAACLAAGASLEARKLVAIKLAWDDRVVAWPLWSVSRACSFVLGFRWNKEWKPTGWIAEDTRFFFSTLIRDRFARNEKPRIWADFATLALDDGWLEHGVSILNGRFRTSLSFAAEASAQPLQPVLLELEDGREQA